jgi:hypothetical protein
MIFYFKQKVLRFLSAFILLITLVNCSGSSVYIREDEVTKSLSYSDTDLKLLAEKMVTSLIETDVLQNKPLMWVSNVQNNTSEYIDTQGILDKISVALLKSGKVRLVERSQLDKLAQEKMIVEYQRIDVKDAVKIGQVVGADYILMGNLMSIEQKDEGVFTEDKLVYYKMTMKLVDKNAEILWMDEKEIKKTSDKDKIFK